MSPSAASPPTVPVTATVPPASAAAGCDTATPFMTHEWALSWWETFGGQQDLWLVLFEDDDGPALPRR